MAFSHYFPDLSTDLFGLQVLTGVAMKRSYVLGYKTDRIQTTIRRNMSSQSSGLRSMPTKNAA
jgi:hypothetical protein